MLYKNESTMTRIILLALALAAMNVFLLETYLVVAVFALLIIRDGKIKVNNDGWVLIMFAVAAVVVYGYYNGVLSTSNIRILTIPMGYLIGYNLYAGRSIDKVKATMQMMTYAMFLHGVLNLVYNWVRYGFSVFYTGITRDFWSRTIAAATGQSPNYFLLAGCIGLLICGNIQKKNRIMLIVATIIAAIHNLLLGGRTYFVLVAFSLILCVVYLLLRSRKKRKILVVISVCVLSAVAIYVLYLWNIFGIRDLFESSYFYYRFFVWDSLSLESSRYTRKLLYLQNMLSYPFGGNNMRRGLGIGYAHGLWLDLYDDVGMIPYLLLIVYTATSLRNIFSFVRKSSNENMHIYFLGIYCVLLASFTTEPTLNGCPMTLIAYCLMDGMIARYMKEARHNGFQE